MKNLIVLCTDPGFFVPSLVVADQVSRQAMDPSPDIILYLNEFTEEQLNEVSFLENEMQIKMQPVQRDLLDIGNTFDEHFTRGISTTALMRLALAELIPDGYDAITYLDGDMQIAGDLTQFLQTPPPPNQILAGSEAYVILKTKQNAISPWLVGYLSNLGMSEPDNYFNSGMLRFRPELWKPIAKEALDYFRKNPAICTNYDQSALNAVLNGNWAKAHPAYNWHTFFNKLAYPSIFEKKIVHFASRPKPWTGMHEGWSPSYALPYIDLVARYPVLAPYIPLRDKPSMLEHIKHFKNRGAAAFGRKRYRAWLGQYMARTDFYI